VKNRHVLGQSFRWSASAALSQTIDVAYFQVRNFRHPQTGSIHGGQNLPVAEVLRSRQQRFDLFPAENDWEFAESLRCRIFVSLRAAFCGAGR
jgi:hypothetical protein